MKFKLYEINKSQLTVDVDDVRDMYAGEIINMVTHKPESIHIIVSLKDGRTFNCARITPVIEGEPDV